MSVSVATTRTAPRPRVNAQLDIAKPRLAIYMHDLSGGGIERQSLVIAQELRRRGGDVTLVLHRLRGPLRDQLPAGLRVVDLESRRTWDDVPRLAAFLRRDRPDILVANFDLNNIAALLAKAISLSPTKVVICQHNPLSRSFYATERRLLRYVGLGYRALAPFVSMAVGVSPGLADELHRLGGLPRERTVTISNPVIGPDFARSAAAPIEHPWLNDPTRPLFVTAGRLVAQKDQATLLRALALHLNHRDMRSRLLILGEGPLEAELKALSKSLGLDQSVDFLGFRPDAPAWFSHADAFILCSRSEGFGNVIVEALGCGTPVIASDCTYGPRDILEGGRFGLLFPPGDPVALARAMDEVRSLHTRFPAETLCQRASAFTYDACAARYVEVFQALTPKRAWTAPA
ncbi:MAG TPA: glycosyltransferase [Rhodopila sp.]|uniref:glycosyltransferase n=1 Tax=Rhodopila sp. TaxID=2480087 RepID=UPI002C9C3DAD|nr:glycosyltransferase [Rhodopila sp.]HVY15000.1 glycosyltransferase [Rhodopila sp.]